MGPNTGPRPQLDDLHDRGAGALRGAVRSRRCATSSSRSIDVRPEVERAFRTELAAQDEEHRVDDGLLRAGTRRPTARCFCGPARRSTIGGGRGASISQTSRKSRSHPRVASARPESRAANALSLAVTKPVSVAALDLRSCFDATLGGDDDHARRLGRLHRDRGALATAAPSSCSRRTARAAGDLIALHASGNLVHRIALAAGAGPDNHRRRRRSLHRRDTQGRRGQGAQRARARRGIASRGRPDAGATRATGSCRPAEPCAQRREARRAHGRFANAQLPPWQSSCRLPSLYPQARTPMTFVRTLALVLGATLVPTVAMADVPSDPDGPGRRRSPREMRHGRRPRRC